jgi:hypothetical protein
VAVALEAGVLVDAYTNPGMIRLIQGFPDAVVI